MVCEPHRYLMSRIAGYSSLSLPSFNYGISTRYNAQSRMGYQGQDAVLFGWSGGAAYQPIEKEQYQSAPQKLYDFGSVRSPGISVVRPIHREQRQESKSDHIDDLPIIKHAERRATAASLTRSPYPHLASANDYSMHASRNHQQEFEMQKQSLARTIISELARIDGQKAELVQMHIVN